MSKWAWCLINDNDCLATGWNKIGDYWYYFWSNGAMATGWIQLDSNWYYLNDSGQMQTGWLTIDSKTYYLEEESNGNKGAMYKGGTFTINGQSYIFNDDGSLQGDVSNGLSDEGAEFISSWEGYSSTWEDVGDGYLTIGIGLATSGTLGQEVYNSGVTSCTKEQAYKWLEEECAECYSAIKAKLDASNITLKQNQIDALVSMAYNIGSSGLLGSTLFKNILNGVTDNDTLTTNFRAWNKCNGVVWEGLDKRRISEAALYLNADYTGNN